MALAKPLILVVDDDPDMRALLQHDLSGAGYDVLATDGPKSARAFLDEHQPDLIISDINMPETSGIEFVGSLREDRARARIPVIYLTARGDSDLAVDTLGYPLLSKPFVAKELLALVKQQIRASR